ncbi:MAG: hypothetical protein WCK01_00335 [Candidatus Uhrbacteria bacterium]
MDPQLIDILVHAVEEEWGRSGRPLSATQLGNVLGDAFRERRLSTGAGAFRPVMMAAVADGRVELLRDGSRIGLKPTGTPPLTALAVGDANNHSAADTPLGLPDAAAYLLPDVYEAFIGRKSPVWVDLEHPPRLTFVDTATANYAPVAPVAASVIREAWEKFATDHSLTADQRSVVAAKLSSDEPRILWGRIDIPEDTYASRLGTQFWRVRMLALVHGIREWFAEQGRDVSCYRFLDRVVARPAAWPPRDSQGHKSAARTTSLRRSETSVREANLRNRLHRIIDSMSLEQLCELRIPAEYFDESF